jgi:hypothetical protein
MTAIERLIEAKSATYTEMREILRGKARAYALERVGGSPTNQRARTMLAAAYDAGVSAMVERARDALKETDSTLLLGALSAIQTENTTDGLNMIRRYLDQCGVDHSEYAAEYYQEPSGVGSGDSAGAFGARTSVLRGRAPSGEGSLGVAPIESENERENIDGDVGGNGDPTIVREEEHVWEVGEYCVWTMHPEYGSARIKWLGSRDVLYDGEGDTKRCKLYFERLDRVEEAYVCELELIEVS